MLQYRIKDKFFQIPIAVILLTFPIFLNSQIQVNFGTGLTYHRIDVQYVTFLNSKNYDVTLSGELSYSFNKRYLIFSEYRYLSIAKDIVPRMFTAPIVGLDFTNHLVSLGVGLKVTDWLTFKTGYFRHFKSTYSYIITIDPDESPSSPFSGQGSQLSVVYQSPIPLSIELVVNLMLVSGEEVRVEHFSTYSLLVKAPLIWRKDKNEKNKAIR